MTAVILMPCEFYYPPKTWHPTYVKPFYFRNRHCVPMNDPIWISLRRLDRFNFLLHNAVLEPPTAPVPLSRIGPPRKVSELRVLYRPPSEYIPLKSVWTTTDVVLARRFRVFHFFKYNISSPFLESPKDPPENYTPSRERKISDLDEIEY
jgi:hypothetical protein